MSMKKMIAAMAVLVLTSGCFAGTASSVRKVGEDFEWCVERDGSYKASISYERSRLPNSRSSDVLISSECTLPEEK